MPVSRRELAARLSSLRATYDRSLEEVATRFATLMKQPAAMARYGTTVIARLFAKGGIDAVEQSPEGEVLDLTCADCTLLAEAYGVHRILLDPVLVAPSEEVCLRERFDDFLVVGDRDEKAYGRDAEYGIPSRKFVGEESFVVVHLHIKPGGCSDIHWHRGDELIFVRKGAIDVLLRNSGLRARLNRWDFIHFYAEQVHWVHNTTSEPADLFILRFRPSRRRFDLLRGLRTKKPRKALVSRAIRELLATVAPDAAVAVAQLEHSPPGVDSPVLDRAGLGRLLQLLSSEKFSRGLVRLTLDELARQTEKIGFNRAKLHRLHHGLAPVTMRDLLSLAPGYGAKPILFYDYLFPVLRNAIAVQQRGDPASPFDDPGDFRAVPPECGGEANCVYRVPCRRLADTDAVFAVVELPRDGSTPENRHPGHEILLPLRGKMDVRFGAASVPINTDEGVFAHFHSDRMHQLCNVGDTPATAFVIRAYD